MKLSFDTGLSPFARGQVVKGEVVASLPSGSLVVLNGVATVTRERLAEGSKVEGRVDQSSTGQAVISLEAASLPAESSDPRSTLLALGLPADPEAVELWAALRKYGVLPGPEGFLKALAAWKQGNLSQGGGLSADAVGLLTAKNLPVGALPLIARYLRGELNFSRLLGHLAPGDLESLRGQWSVGKVLERLAGLASHEQGAGIRSGASEFSQDLVDNLQFQELFAQLPKPTDEGRLYFQWPVFWQGQTIPDTLEGEAFFGGSDKPEQGFSLRVVVSPPRLGAMEIGLHRLQETIWVHFGAEQPSTRSLLIGLFSGLTERLQELGWRQVRLTTGVMPLRANFHAPAEGVLPPVSLRHPVDVKV